VDPYARRTRRLAETLHLIGHALGGEAGARVANHLGLGVSPDTLLDRLRQVEARRASSPAPMPRVLGVDDFAFRKGVRCGTILIDLERGEPIDLLPDRRAETLATWLRERPGVETVARDRSSAYGEGVRQGAPNAVQVADRWHLLKNLTDALEALLTREHRSLQQAAQPPVAPADVPAEESLPDLQLPAPTPTPTPTPALHARPGRSRRENEEPTLRRERHVARYEAVMQLARQGLTARAIARQLVMSHTTVGKYMAAGSFPERKVRANPPTQLTPFAPYLERRWQEGCHNSVQLWREIREQGFPGGQIAVYRFTAAWRERQPSLSPSSVPPLPAPRKVLWWLIGEREQLDAEQQAFTARLCEICPPVKVAVEQVREFFQLVRARRSEALVAWVDATEASGVVELERFCRGVRSDWKAVLASLELPWSNGPTEGHVNRLKLIKRQMYGRAKFDLLRARVLRAA
jgi:transposase